MSKYGYFKPYIGTKIRYKIDSHKFLRIYVISFYLVSIPLISYVLAICNIQKL